MECVKQRLQEVNRRGAADSMQHAPILFGRHGKPLSVASMALTTAATVDLTASHVLLPEILVRHYYHTAHCRCVFDWCEQLQQSSKQLRRQPRTSNARILQQSSQQPLMHAQPGCHNQRVVVVRCQQRRIQLTCVLHRLQALVVRLPIVLLRCEWFVCVFC